MIFLIRLLLGWPCTILGYLLWGVGIALMTIGCIPAVIIIPFGQVFVAIGEKLRGAEGEFDRLPIPPPPSNRYSNNNDPTFQGRGGAC